MTKTTTFTHQGRSVTKTGRNRTVNLNGFNATIAPGVRFTASLAKRFLDYVAPELMENEL